MADNHKEVSLATNSDERLSLKSKMILLAVIIAGILVMKFSDAVVEFLLNILGRIAFPLG